MMKHKRQICKLTSAGSSDDAGNADGDAKSITVADAVCDFAPSAD